MKKFICSFLSLVIIFSLTTSAFGYDAANEYDPARIDAQYVQELVDLKQEEIAALPLEQAEQLFEKAFNVSAKDYTENEIRMVLDGLGYGLKFQIYTNVANTFFNVRSVKGHSVGYYGDIGVAWTRDTSKSPLTLQELLSGMYTLEVDYLTWESAASILTASISQSTFDKLADLVATGVSSTVLGNFIATSLELTGTSVSVASVVASVVIGFGWDWLRNLDRNSMLSVFQAMSHTNKLKVEFMWTSNAVTRIYTSIPKTNIIANPYPDVYSDWTIDTYGILYNY